MSTCFDWFSTNMPKCLWVWEQKYILRHCTVIRKMEWDKKKANKMEKKKEHTQQTISALKQGWSKFPKYRCLTRLNFFFVSNNKWNNEKKNTCTQSHIYFGICMCSVRRQSHHQYCPYDHVPDLTVSLQYCSQGSETEAPFVKRGSDMYSPLRALEWIYAYDCSI